MADAKLQASRLVLIVDDDPYVRCDIRQRLLDRDISSCEASNEAESLQVLAASGGDIAVALIDMRFPSQPGAQDADSPSGQVSGLRLGRHIRRCHPHIRLLGMSQHAEEDARQWFHEYGAGFLNKGWVRSGAFKDFIDAVENAGRARQRKPQPQSFIVHGHDSGAVHELARFIRNKFKWPEPRILREMPSLGRTVIEKFEDTAHAIDVVFVLLTPDDVGAAASSSNDVKRRARQNVIFELGYFFAKLQRKGGRVLLLHKGDVEIPSDIGGIIGIDISNGIEAAGENLRTELERWL